MMRPFCVKMPPLMVEAIDRLVREGKFASRSEVVRVAVARMLMEYGWPLAEKCHKRVRGRGAGDAGGARPG